MIQSFLQSQQGLWEIIEVKQVLQGLKDGNLSLGDVPAPCCGRNKVVVQSVGSLISAGTERMLLEFGRGSWISKARQQPDKVRMVLSKIRSDGIFSTLDLVRSKLDQPIALGYCNVGRVVEIGSGVAGLKLGDRVVSNGNHAEVVCVPHTLCAKIPDGVSDEDAAFAVVAAIGLQGVRLARPTLGECCVVTGLGLIGLLTVQLLRSHGCRVMGIDFDESRREMARKLGAEVVANPSDENAVISAALGFSRGRGVDAVILAASTASSDPVRMAAQMCRKRGRVVLVGVTGLELSRSDFYEKELSFQVSCSYGPGRYDPVYEEGGNDYPVAFVRWTQQRNFEAVLDMMATGSLDVKPLISHRFELSRAEEAYSLLASGESSLGILLRYDQQNFDVALQRTVEISPGEASREKAEDAHGHLPSQVDFLGAGNYAGRVLMPAFRGAGAVLGTVVSGGGVTAYHFGRKYGARSASTDWQATVASSPSSMVVVATRHNLHAGQVVQALRAGKHVFCEKPLCLTHDELSEIAEESRGRPDQIVMLGFNRRFAPHTGRIRQLLGASDEPKIMVMTVNAGAIPADHWTQNSSQGGGRVLGEGCHFIDLLRYLAGSTIKRWNAVQIGGHASIPVRSDKATITLEFENGSIGTLHYLANGDKAFPKERLEVFSSGRVLQLDNFRRLRGWGWKNFKTMNLWRQDKGVDACVRAFVNAVQRGLPSPIAVDEILEVSRVSIEVAEALR